MDLLPWCQRNKVRYLIKRSNALHINKMHVPPRDAPIPNKKGVAKKRNGMRPPVYFYLYAFYNFFNYYLNIIYPVVSIATN